MNSMYAAIRHPEMAQAGGAAIDEMQGDIQLGERLSKRTADREEKDEEKAERAAGRVRRPYILQSNMQYAAAVGITFLGVYAFKKLRAL